MAYQTSDQLNNSRERSRVVLSNSHDWLAQEYQWDPYRLIAARSSPPATHAEGKTPVHASGKTPIVGAVPAAWDGKVSTPVDEGGLIVGAEPTILSASKRAYDRSLPLICQVTGCGQELMGTKPYYRRYRVCPLHLNMPSLMVDGCSSRFCQQCGRFHPVTDFDDNRRSCRTRLGEHNARRRKRKEGNSRLLVTHTDKPEDAEDSRSDSPASKRSSAHGSFSSGLHHYRAPYSQPLPQNHMTRMSPVVGTSVVQSDLSQTISSILMAQQRISRGQSNAGAKPTTAFASDGTMPLLSNLRSPPLQLSAEDQGGSLQRKSTGTSYHPKIPDDLLHLFQGTSFPKDKERDGNPYHHAAPAPKSFSNKKELKEYSKSQPLPLPVPCPQPLPHFSNQMFHLESDNRESASGMRILPFDAYESQDLDCFGFDEEMGGGGGGGEEGALEPGAFTLPLPKPHHEDDVEALVPWTSTEEAFSWLEAATAPTSEPKISSLLLNDRDQGAAMPSPKPSSSTKHLTSKSTGLPMLPDLSHFPSYPTSSSSSVAGTERPYNAAWNTAAPPLPSSSLDFARMLVATGDEEPTPYVPDEVMARVSVKVANCTPDQLPADLFARLKDVLSTVDASVVQGYLRPGCVHLVLDVKLHGSGRKASEINPRDIAWACGLSSKENEEEDEEARGISSEQIEDAVYVAVTKLPGDPPVVPARLLFASPLAPLTPYSSPCGDEEPFSSSFLAAVGCEEPVEDLQFLLRMQGGYLPVVAHRITMQEALDEGANAEVQGGPCSHWFRIEVLFAPGPGLAMLELQSPDGSCRLSNWLPILFLPPSTAPPSPSPMSCLSSSLTSHLLMDIGQVLDHLNSVVLYYHCLNKPDDCDSSGPLSKVKARSSLHKIDKAVDYLNTLVQARKEEMSSLVPLLDFMNHKRPLLASLCCDDDEEEEEREEEDGEDGDKEDEVGVEGKTREGELSPATVLSLSSLTG